MKPKDIVLEFSGPFAPMCEAYVRQRRALGVQYNGQIWTLRSFDNFAKDFCINDYIVTKDLATAWAVKSPNESEAFYNSRLYVMWQFADFLVQQGYDSQLSRFKLRKSSKHTPYIFTKDEIRKIFAKLDTMEHTPCSPVKHIAFPVLFRILYGCGLRISEALSLTFADINIENRMIHVVSGKNGKERLVPISDSLARHCSVFISSVHNGHDETHLLFHSRDCKPYTKSNIDKYFRSLLWDVGIPYCGKFLGPRLHDIRHTFVCHRLNDWVKNGVDLMATLPVLSKYLGHENVTGTAWYLKLTAEAYPDITDKMNALAGYVFPEVGGEYIEES